MNEKNNLSKNISCEYYVPLGKAGSLIIQAPVVLSYLKVNIPVYTNINLSKNCLNVKTTQNKIFIKKPLLASDNKLILTGHIEKSLSYKTNSNNTSKFSGTKTLNIDIQIEEHVNITFDQFPVKNEKNTEFYYEKSDEPINCNMEFIELIQDNIQYTDSGYVNKLILSLQFSLTQLQYVFIPEPEGDVQLLNPNSNTPIQTPKTNNFYYNIGFNNSVGLIANRTFIYNSPWLLYINY